MAKETIRLSEYFSRLQFLKKPFRLNESCPSPSSGSLGCFHANALFGSLQSHGTDLWGCSKHLTVEKSFLKGNKINQSPLQSCMGFGGMEVRYHLPPCKLTFVVHKDSLPPKHHSRIPGNAPGNTAKSTNSCNHTTVQTFRQQRRFTVTIVAWNASINTTHEQPLRNSILC